MAATNTLGTVTVDINGGLPTVTVDLSLFPSSLIEKITTMYSDFSALGLSVIDGKIHQTYIKED